LEDPTPTLRRIGRLVREDGLVLLADFDEQGFDLVERVHRREGREHPRSDVTVTKATPLILAGLGVALPLRCGLVNLGGEGQVYIGALVATLAALGLRDLPATIHLPIVIPA